MRTKMDDTISGITNVFAGGDGGVTFLKFRMLALAMEKQAIDGDPSAEQICEVIDRFKRLLDYAAKQ